jgi:protein gp37
MGDATPIEWTDATWNPVGGCSPASPGCANCYAQRLAGTRLKHHPLYRGTTSPSKAGPVFNGTMTVAADDHEVWTWPLRWRGAKQPRLGFGKPSLIFVDDMADLFHEARSIEVIDRVVAAIVYSRHIGQLLTKRAAVMRDYFIELRESARWVDWPHPLLGVPNFDPVVATFERVFRRLWLGVSVEDQARADERIPPLLETPAGVRFLSCEPLLGPLDLKPFLWVQSIGSCRHETRRSMGMPALDQVIAGYESGEEARARHPDIARALRDQCAAAGVPFLFKQWGEFRSHHEAEAGDSDIVVDGHHMVRCGKKASGRLLDGVEHNAFPAPSP